MYSCDYLKKISMKINRATDEGNSQNETGHWRNDEIGEAVHGWLKVELSESWTHDLIAQLVRVSTFYNLFKESFSGEYLYIYITVRLQQSAQWEEQIIGIKNDSLVYNY